MKRQRISTGAPWEAIVGFSRAVRVGTQVHVSGTISADETGAIAGVGDPYAQTIYILNKIAAALARAGASMADVVRTRIYVTDISRWEEVGRAHGEFFREVLPTTSMVEVRALITPEAMVEIEAEAILTN